VPTAKVTACALLLTLLDFVGFNGSSRRLLDSTMSLYLLGDAYNILYIKRRAEKDPTYLDKRIN
jgi:hypothetical protein